MEHSSTTTEIVLVREKDVCWEYCEKLDGNKVKCKFCFKVLNGGISRLKHHLSRLPSKGVLPCSKVRDDVTDRVRAIIAMKEEGKEAASAKKQRLAESKPPMIIPTNKPLMSIDTSPLAKVFPSSTHMGIPSSYEGENAERSIALFFFENKLDFSIARSSSYQLMIDTVAKCGNGFRGPSLEALKTTWLERIKSEVSEQSREIEKEWAITGGQELVRTGITKSVSNFLSLQSMLKLRSRLKHMFNSPEFSTNPAYSTKPQSITCIDILADNDIWKAVEESVAVSEPQIHSDKRNKLDKETLTDMVYVNYNLKLASRMKGKPLETDPILVDDIDMTSDWVEEVENPSPAQWLDRFGSAMDGGDLNTRHFTNAMFGASDHIFGL
ncbi:hAT transposon superfamily [Thalictrum thalictroides]|uniref:HAT transposon superfamily n=1 Tax=Thalictrum thalictroides TaxID=46969 RepID=A0A7J6UWW7_THATH|nr:hAT transposon superfamily [Thalictrum thalictroides]